MFADVRERTGLQYDIAAAVFDVFHDVAHCERGECIIREGSVTRSIHGGGGHCPREESYRATGREGEGWLWTKYDRHGIARVAINAAIPTRFDTGHARTINRGVVTRYRPGTLRTLTYPNEIRTRVNAVHAKVE